MQYLEKHGSKNEDGVLDIQTLVAPDGTRMHTFHPTATTDVFFCLFCKTKLNSSTRHRHSNDLLCKFITVDNEESTESLKMPA